MLDTFHMNIEEVSIVDALQQAGKRLGYIHFADSNRWAPGWGHTPFDKVIAALRDISYQGWISAEILPLPDDLAAARQSIDFARSIGAVE
jgi:sugar phosphate isomerase/epimerase